MDNYFENIEKAYLFKNYNNTLDEHANIIAIMKEYDVKYVKEINNLLLLISNFI